MSTVADKKEAPRAQLGEASLQLSLKQRIIPFYNRHRDGFVGYSLLAPMFVFFAVFSLFPLLFVIYLSFTEWNGVLGWPKWIGLDNFHRFFTTGDYMLTLLHAGMYGLLILAGCMFIGFFVAILLNQKVSGVGIYRTLWYLPVLVSFAVVAQIANALLDPVTGLVRKVMERFGMEPIIFQQSVFWMTFWLIIISIWKGIGGTVIIYLAGLQGIDTTLYEAAKVDGATRFKILLYVTLPSLRPITMYIAIMGIIGSFQIFEPVQLLTRGGPQGHTNIILHRIYQDAFQSFNMGMASASSVMVLIFTFVLTMIQYRISQRNQT
ncbi:multiple sugar transport system permease protein [Paenibacillus taihuensis]|uniref:Multiple sugar transport system permease protein n=1 Tax=Paenibacillus taihuensis TaxID=1156355 RepID=A0A3D9RT62_9BACL|nr:sugar ABC transporter permease [Paenibacillus taihuensis]REE82638.1 multiple sugar transport system permease protein [Paenibacillus taihuensis]